MKKFLALYLVALFLLLNVTIPLSQAKAELVIEEEGGEVWEEEADAEASAEEEAHHTKAAKYNYTTLDVGTTTAFTGNFFDKVFTSSGSDQDVMDLLHAYSLVEWSSDNGSYAIDASVVTSFMSSLDEEGNLVLTLSLYDNMTYSDGTPVTAKDYLFSILLCSSPEIKRLGGNTSKASALLGWDAYAENGGIFTGLRLLGTYDLRLTVKAAYVPYFYELALLDWKPYPMQVIAPGCDVADDGEGAYLTGDFSAELLEKTLLDAESGYVYHPTVVTGAYLLNSFDGKKATFTINSAYKGNAKGLKPTIENLSFQLVENDEAYNLLTDGSLGLINKVTKSETVLDMLGAVTSGEYRMASYPRVGCSMFSFCCERLAVGEEAVRQAVAYCLNKAQMVDDYVGSYGLRVDGYYGIGQWIYQLLNGTIEPSIDAPAANASAAELKAYEETLEAWDALSMDEIPVYEQDIGKARQLLAEAGWNLNAQGEAYTDGVRYKAFDTEALKAEGKYEAALAQGGVEKDGKLLLPLTLRCVYPEGNRISESLEACLITPLAEAGIRLTVEALPMNRIVQLYNRNTERDCDLIYLANNFSAIFDPAAEFDPADAESGVNNATGLKNEALYEAAVRMQKTEPGDLYNYCLNWIEFQKEFQQSVPAICIYSNVYFDFYTTALHDFNVSQNTSWASAIVGAYMSDPDDETEEETDEEADDETEVFMD